jgi:hypothetical protein
MGANVGYGLDGHQVGGEYGDVVDWIMIEVVLGRADF